MDPQRAERQTGDRLSDPFIFDERAKSSAAL
jgi:hypothetical protein